MKRIPGSRVLRAAALAAVPSVLALWVAVAPAQAAPLAPGSGTTAHVVVVADRSPIGKMLIDNNAGARKGLSLYINPSGCNASCQSVWPPLLLPKGKTTPTGAKCLSAVAASGGRLQVTYHSQRLYTFVDDSGTSVNGNGVGGFKAAKLLASCP